MSWWEILIGYAVTVVALTFMWHMVIQRGKASEPPDCFATEPTPLERAENDCRNCPWKERCIGEK